MQDSATGRTPQQSGSPAATTTDELIARLEQTFFSNAGASSVERQAALAAAIAEATQNLGPDQAHALLDDARRRLAGGEAVAAVEPAESAEKLAHLAAENEALKTHLAELEREISLRSAAYDHLVDLSNHFLGDGARFDHPEQIQRFCHRIKNSFTILLAAFKDLLKGRKRFQMEYAMFFGMGKPMEGTRIIRTGEDKDVGKKFFEWDTLENVEDSTKEMAQALDELKYHQLAFLSGYKRSVKDGTLNAIGRLSPAQLEKDLAERNISLGPVPVPGRLWPWKRRWLYNEFRRRYAELAREDVQYFEAKFRQAFTAGYVDVMNRKAKAQQMEPSDRG